MMQTGWLCPRCETVHAPDVKQCSCRPQLDIFGEETIKTPWTNEIKFQAISPIDIEEGELKNEVY